jgi:hypothetical protein
MSDKIYDGCLLKISSLKELSAFANRLRREVKLVQLEECLKLYARDIENFVDSMTLGIADLKADYNDYSGNQSIEDYIYDRMRNKVMKNVQCGSYADINYDSDYNLCFSVCVFPISRKTLCIPFCNNYAILKFFRKQPEVAEYGYWDNTDPLKGFTRKQWLARKKAWDEALPGIGIPSENGVSLRIIQEENSIIPGFYYSGFEAYAKHMCPKEQRADYYASYIVKSDKVNELFEEYKKDHPEYDESKNMAHDYIRMDDEASKFVISHPEMVQEKKEELMSILVDIDENFIKNHKF